MEGSNHVDMKIVYKQYIYIYTTILLICLFPAGCDKDTRHPVPLVEVDFRINLEIVYGLNTINGFVNFSGGYRGIVVYRLSEDEYMAYDRACTNDIYEQIVVNEPPIAECEGCESTFLLVDGTVITGPAKHPLRRYRTVLDYPYLYVHN